MATDYEDECDDWFVEGPFKIAESDKGHVLYVSIDSLSYCWAIYKFKPGETEKGKGRVIESGYFEVNASKAAHPGMHFMLKKRIKHVKVFLAPAKKRTYKKHVKFEAKELRELNQPSLRKRLNRALPKEALDMFKGIEEAMKDGPPPFNPKSDKMKMVFSSRLSPNPPKPTFGFSKRKWK